jgi:hypothetical protein
MHYSLRIAAPAIVALGLAGAQHAQAADTYTKRTKVAVPLPTGVSTLVAQVTVPPGRWLITSEVGAVNFGLGDFVRCELFSGAKHLDGSGTYVGQQNGYPPLAVISNQAVASPTAIAVISLRCYHDSAAGANTYIDPDGSLVVSPITGLIRP